MRSTRLLLRSACAPTPGSRNSHPGPSLKENTTYSTVGQMMKGVFWQRWFETTYFEVLMVQLVKFVKIFMLKSANKSLDTEEQKESCMSSHAKLNRPEHKPSPGVIPKAACLAWPPHRSKWRFAEGNPRHRALEQDSCSLSATQKFLQILRLVFLYRFFLPSAKLFKVKGT